MEEKKRKAVIGLGANLGEREETIRRALEAVNALPGTKVLRQAPLYETAPVGSLDQPNFLNTAAEVETWEPAWESRRRWAGCVPSPLRRGWWMLIFCSWRASRRRRRSCVSPIPA